MNLEFDIWPAGAHERAIMLATDLIGDGPATREHVEQLARIVQRAEFSGAPVTDVRPFVVSVLDACGHTEASITEAASDLLDRVERAARAMAHIAEQLYEPLRTVFEMMAAKSKQSFPFLPPGRETSIEDRRCLLLAICAILYLDRPSAVLRVPLLASSLPDQIGEDLSVVRRLSLDLEFVSTALLVLELGTWMKNTSSVDLAKMTSSELKRLPVVIADVTSALDTMT